MDKITLRKHIREQLASLDQITYEHQSYLIANRLFETAEWKQAITIGITVSIYPEVDTWQIIRKAWEQGKNISVPRCIPADRRMNFKTITAFNELEKVDNGLYEPKEGLTCMNKDDHDLIIVPGLSFDRSGYRVGFGGGYFDRYLAEFKGNTIALAFTTQLFDKVPTDEYDLPVQKIITEQEMILCQ